MYQEDGCRMDNQMVSMNKQCTLGPYQLIAVFDCLIQDKLLIILRYIGGFVQRQSILFCFVCSGVHTDRNVIDPLYIQWGENGWVKINYMSVTVKVQFGDKLFKLTQGITSIAQIDQEMRRRYPKRLPQLEYYCEGSIVSDLKKWLSSYENKGKATIKIEARPSTDLSQINDLSLISIVSNQKVEEKVEEKIEKKPVTLPTIEYRMPKQYYACYNCQGKGLYEDGSQNMLCQICKGRGQLNNDHKYIIHIQKLFKQHIPIVKPQEPKKQFPRVFRALSKVYEMNINDLSKVDKMEIGNEFTYKFEVHNLGRDLPQDLQVVNFDTKETMKAKTLKKGEKMIIEVGPYKCQNETLLEQHFYLCYRIQDGWERLGYRFGFRIKGVKKTEVKKMECSQRDMIRNLKMLSGSRKSQEYIEMKLKSMEIDINNMQIEDEILLEIIKNIN